jgi:hypothetical protein
MSTYDQILEDNMSGLSNMVNLGRDRTAIQSSRIAEYSVILDGATCPLCKDLDGNVYAVGSDAYYRYMPPQHGRCRCIYVYIGNDEANPPPITSKEPSKELVQKHGQLTGQNLSLKSTIAPNKVLTTSAAAKVKQQTQSKLSAGEKATIEKVENGAFINSINKLKYNNIKSQELKNLDNVFKNIQPIGKSVSVFAGVSLSEFKGIESKGTIIKNPYASGKLNIDKVNKNDALLQVNVPAEYKLLILDGVDVMFGGNFAYKVSSVKEIKNAEFRYNVIVDVYRKD